MEVVASLSQGRTAAAQCGLFTYKSVPVIFEPPCTYNQRSVVSALLPTSKQYSMTASRDYMISMWCLWHSLLYASRLVLRHSSASHCRMHVRNGNMRPGTGPWHQFYRAARGLRKLHNMLQDFISPLTDN